MQILELGKSWESYKLSRSPSSGHVLGDVPPSILHASSLIRRLCFLFHSGSSISHSAFSLVSVQSWRIENAALNISVRFRRIHLALLNPLFISRNCIRVSYFVHSAGCHPAINSLCILAVCLPTDSLPTSSLEGRSGGVLPFSFIVPPERRVPFNYSPPLFPLLSTFPTIFPDLSMKLVCS